MTHGSYVHDQLLYDTDEELVAAVAPYVAAGSEAGETVVVSTTAPVAELLHRALGHDDQVVHLRTEDAYAHPPRTLTTFMQMVRDHVRAGTTGFRIVGQIDWDVSPERQREWLRHESLVNRALGEFAIPIHGLCLYDLRSVPLDVIAAAARAHPHHVDLCGRRANPTYAPPEVFLPSVATPVELPADPAVTLRLREPSDMASFRSALTAASAESRLGPADVDAFVVAVFEIVTNALLHGEPPVDIRLAVTDGRISCSVTDVGSGFDDPLAGHLPPPEDATGASYGLWLARQLCDHVTSGQTDDGFCVRLDLLAG